jgi:hypothetical protein
VRIRRIRLCEKGKPVVRRRREAYRRWALVERGEPVAQPAIANISSEGGVPLRLESFRNNWTPIDNLVADGVRCKNGHDAVHMNPHGAQHGKVTIRNVVAHSCESALSLKTDEVLGGSFGADSPITGMTVIPGNQAQLRTDATTDPVDAWVIGPSRWCIDNDDPLGYTIGLSNVDCGGLPNRRP